jgi:hypothetical protein
MCSPFIDYSIRLQKSEKRDGAAPLQHSFVIDIVRREASGAISSEELFASGSKGRNLKPLPSSRHLPSYSFR